MKSALVLGATGGMGYSIVNELINRDIDVIAYSRSNGKLEKMFAGNPKVIIKQGDAFSQNDLEKAAIGVDTIFQAINIPYSEWENNLMPLTKNIIKTTKNASAKLVVVDNIYAYGKNPGFKVTEATPQKPNTKKGKIRLEMAKLIKQSGIPYVIAHFPDFYGPYAENSQLNYLLRQVAKNKKGQFIGKQTVAREHIYTPDGAKAIVELALTDDALGECFNIPAYDVITGEQIVKIIREVTDYRKSVSTVSRNLLRFVGLFNKQMREFVEMQYLNEDPVVLNGEKYEKIIGPLPRTSYQEGIRKTMAAYKQSN